MAGPVFVLDANVFFEAKNRYYAFDLGTSFWDSLVNLAANGRVESIDRIKKELLRGRDNPKEGEDPDELAVWVKGDFAQAFVSTDEKDVIRSYADVMNWVDQQTRFTDAAKAKFAGGADGLLVAYAMARGRVVVTHEQPAPESKNEVKIPDVCLAFNVRPVDTFQMLRELRQLGEPWKL